MSKLIFRNNNVGIYYSIYQEVALVRNKVYFDLKLNVTFCKKIYFENFHNSNSLF